MRADDVDVLVVGAGPTGSTTAAEIKRIRPDLRVALTDRARFPRDKSCGDGIGPGVVRLLDSFGDLDRLAGHSAPTTVRVAGPDGREAIATGPTLLGRTLQGFVIPRYEFDQLLVTRAIDNGVEFLPGLRFEASALDAEARLATFVDDSGSPRKIRSHLLAGADGAHSKVRRDLGVARPHDAHQHVAMRAYVTLAYPDGRPPALQLEFTRALCPAYGWVFPLLDGRANVGVGLPRGELTRRRANPHGLLAEFIAGLRERGYEVSEPESKSSHHLPHSAGLPRLSHAHAVLLGDAANMINPLSGEGIYYGMVAGRMLAERLEDADLRVPGKPLLAFERAFRQRFRSHLRSAYYSHRLMRSPRWAKHAIGRAATDERVMAAAAFMLFDEDRIRVPTALRLLGGTAR